MPLALCQELFNTCAAQGDGELDHSVLVKALETMAAHKTAGETQSVPRLAACCCRGAYPAAGDACC